MKLLTVLTGAFCLLLPGCQNRPSHKEIQKELALQQELVGPQIDRFQTFVETCKDIGVAEVVISPGAASLWIDGAEYVGDRAEVTLPVGPHEFKAVWADGKEAARRIHVEPALREVNFEWNYERTSSGLKASWKMGQPQIRKTPVKLQRS